MPMCKFKQIRNCDVNVCVGNISLQAPSTNLACFWLFNTCACTVLKIFVRKDVHFNIDHVTSMSANHQECGCHSIF